MIGEAKIPLFALCIDPRCPCVKSDLGQVFLYHCDATTTVRPFDMLSWLINSGRIPNSEALRRALNLFKGLKDKCKFTVKIEASFKLSGEEGGKCKKC